MKIKQVLRAKWILSFLLLACVGVILACSQIEVQAEPSEMEYTILREKDFSMLNAVRKAIRIRIDRKINEEEIEVLAESIRIRKFRRVDSFGVLMYLPKMDFNSAAYATAYWNWGDENGWRVNIQDWVLPKERSFKETESIALETRKKIYSEYQNLLSNASKLVWSYVDKGYTFDAAHEKLRRQGLDQDTAGVTIKKRYKISSDVLNKINIEGMDENWPVN